MTQPYDPDLFGGGEKTPAVSYKNAPVGTVKRMKVTDAPKLLQSSDFNTGEPKYWPLKANQAPPGDPVMSVVINGEVDGEMQSFWAQKPSAMFAAIKDAQKEAGAALAPGGILEVAFVGEKDHTDPVKIKKDLPKQKLYAAKYTPPAPADPFADAGAAPAATPNGWIGTASAPATATWTGAGDPPF